MNIVISSNTLIAGIVGIGIGAAGGVLATYLALSDGSKSTPREQKESLSITQNAEVKAAEKTSLLAPESEKEAEYVGGGPFGFEMGAPVARFPNCAAKDNAPGGYLCSSAPKPYPAFEQYLVRATSETGICMIRGIGKTIDGDTLGIEIRSAADNLRDDISSKYGPASKKYDAAAGLWGDPQYWMMGILKKSRVYGYSWNLKAPVNGVTSIAIVTSALSSDSGFIGVEFTLSNAARCLEILDKAKASAL